MKGALTFTMFCKGIPIVYYGTEQEFDGGNDPYDRMPLWTTNLNTDAPVYKYLAALNKARKDHKIWEQEQIERWADDSFYAFSRGDVLVTLTNDQSGNT